MARLNKFASVNLNDSYGNPDQRHAGSASSSSTKPRAVSSASGGMLVLTRPGRGQVPQPKPLAGRLGIPSPVNLPSLKREGSVIGAPETVAISPPVASWSKADQISGSPSPGVGWSSAKVDPRPPTPPSDVPDAIHRRSVTVNSTENIKPLKPDVYAPPALRSIQASSSSGTGTTPPPTAPLEKKPVIRVEEFPTLQAAVARPPTPPQHTKNKDKKHLQDGKEQQQYGQKKSQDPRGTVLSPQALRPFGIQEPISHKANAFSQSPHPVLPSNSSIYQVNKQVFDPSNEVQNEAPFVNYKSDVPRELDAHNLRPQYRTNSPMAYDNVELRTSSIQLRRELLPYEKLDNVNPGIDYMVKPSEGRDLKISSFGKETYASKGFPVSRENTFYERDEYNKEGTENMPHVRSPVTVYNSHDRNGQKAFAKDLHDEDAREPSNKGIQDSHSRDSADIYNRKIGGFRGSHSSRPYSPGQGPRPWYNRRYSQYGSGDNNTPKVVEENSSLDPKFLRGLYVEPIDSFSSTESNKIRAPSSGSRPIDCAKEYSPQLEITHKASDPDQQLIYEHKGRELKSKSSEEKETDHDTAQRLLNKKEASQGITGRSALIDVNKKHDEEQTSRDDLKKQIVQNEEKRKEAARLKLLELEERIARREAEEVKKEVELKNASDKKPPNVGAPLISEFSSGRDVKQAMLEQRLPQEPNDSLMDKERNLLFKAEHMDTKFSQASWGSLSSRVAAEALVTQEPPQGIQSSLSQDRKIVRSRSPTSWRKESGSGPTSKLFSSPYIESGGLRRPTDGGTYKLF